jgi:hypothetical protein
MTNLGIEDSLRRGFRGLAPGPATLIASARVSANGHAVDDAIVLLKIRGLAPQAKPRATETRDSAEPPRDDPRRSINPDHVGG